MTAHDLRPVLQSYVLFATHFKELSETLGNFPGVDKWVLFLSCSSSFECSCIPLAGFTYKQRFAKIPSKASCLRPGADILVFDTSDAGQQPPKRSIQYIILLQSRQGRGQQQRSLRA